MDLRRRATAMLAGLAMASMELVAPPTPVAAAPAPAPAPADSDTLVFAGYDADTWVVVRNGVETLVSAPGLGAQPLIAGDFSAAPGTDLFLYGWGGEPDGVLHVEPDGTGVTTSFTPKAVQGYSYVPLAGDFDGNALTDILWYGREDAPDWIWLFQPDGSHVSRPTRVDGSYIPFVVEATGDAHDDILWYGNGTDPDHLWVFGEGAGHTSRPMRVDGHYRPLVGHFRDTPEGSSQEQVVWYGESGPDHLWTFTAGGHTSRPLPTVDEAFPVVGDLLGTGRDAIFWDRPGDAPDDLGTFAADGTPALRPAPKVRGAYTPLVGDVDGNGREDIAWTTQGGANVWTLDGTGTSYTQTRVRTGHTYSVASVARTDPADL